MPAALAPRALIDAGFKPEELDGSWVAYRAQGCSACSQGYAGRIGVHQVMPVSDEIQRIILRDGSAMEIAVQAQLEGVNSLRQSGLRKVKLGLTSLQEILSCTNP
jgi:type IV pilus assembly protein PilB